MRRRRQVSAARRPLADGGERRAAARAACGVTGRARGPGRAARDRLRALDGRGRGALQGVGSPCPPTARGRVEHTWRPAHPGCQRLKSGSQASEVRKERAAQAGPSRHRREVGAGAPAHDCSVRSPGRRPGRECGVRARPSGSGSRCPWLVRCTQTAEPRAVPRSPSLRSRCFGALSGPPRPGPQQSQSPLTPEAPRRRGWRPGKSPRHILLPGSPWLPPSGPRRPSSKVHLNLGLRGRRPQTRTGPAPPRSSPRLPSPGVGGAVAADSLRPGPRADTRLPWQLGVRGLHPPAQAASGEAP